MTPDDPACIHGVPLNDTTGECFECATLIVEQERRDLWLDGLVRMAEFLQKHPDFIPRLGVVALLRETSDVARARTRVFDLVEAAGPVERNTLYQDESKVTPTGFGPHRFDMIVPNAAIGKNVIAVTEVWEWDESIFEAKS